MRQPTPGDGPADNRWVLYDDAKLIVAECKNLQLISFLGEHEDFFRSYFASHHIDAVAVVATVDAFMVFPAACFEVDSENAYRSLKATGTTGADTDVADKQQLFGGDDENVDDDQSGIRAKAIAKLRKMVNPKNIAQRSHQQHFILLLRRALNSSERVLELQELVEPPKVIWEKVEDVDGREHQCVKGEKDWRFNQNGLRSYMIDCYDYRVEWTVIDRALRNLRTFYRRLLRREKDKA